MVKPANEFIPTNLQLWDKPVYLCVCADMYEYAMETVKRIPEEPRPRKERNTMREVKKLIVVCTYHGASVSCATIPKRKEVKKERESLPCDANGYCGRRPGWIEGWGETCETGVEYYMMVQLFAGGSGWLLGARFSISARHSSNTLPTFTLFLALVSTHAALFACASFSPSAGSICLLD